MVFRAVEYRYSVKTYNIEKLEYLSICAETIESCAGRVYINGEYLVILGVYRPHSDSIDNLSVRLESILNNELLSPVSKASMFFLAGEVNVILTDVDSLHVDNYVSLRILCTFHQLLPNQRNFQMIMYITHFLLLAIHG